MKRALLVGGRLAVLTAGGTVRGCVVIDDTPSSARVGVTAVGYVAGLMVTVVANPSGAPLIDVLGLGRSAQIAGAGATLIPWASLVDGPLPSSLVIQARPVGADGAPTGPYSTEITVDLENLIDPNEPPTSLTPPALTFSGGGPAVGATITEVAGSWAGATTGPAVRTMRQRPAAGGAEAIISPRWTVVPSLASSIEISLGETVTGPNGATATAWSPWYTITVASGLRPLTAADITVTGSVLTPVGQGRWFKPEIQLPGLVGETVVERQWSAVASGAEVWQPLPLKAGSTTTYIPDWTSPGDPDDAPRVDMSYFESAEAARRASFRIRYRAVAGGPWSPASAAVSIPVPAAPALALPSTSILVQAARRSEVQYRVAQGFSDGTEGQGANYPAYAHHWVSMAVAAFAGDTTVYTGGSIPSGGRTLKQRLVAQLRTWANNRFVSGTCGYGGQFQVAGLVTVVICRMMPDVWGQLTAAEQARLDIGMRGSLVGAAWLASDTSNAGWTIRGYTGNRGWNPNISIPCRLLPFLIAQYMGGAAEAADYLNGWTRAAFLAEIEAAFSAYIPANGAGRVVDIWDTFRFAQWTTSVQDFVHGTGSRPLGQGPTTSQIQSAVRNLRIFGRSLSQGVAAVEAEILRCCPHRVAPGLGPNLEGAGATVYGIFEYPRASNARNKYVGRLTNSADFATLPNWNPTTRVGSWGMWAEMNTTDGGRDTAAGLGPATINLKVRSALSYSMDGWQALASIIMGMACTGLLRSGDLSPDALGRMGIASTDMIYKAERGYETASKGGRPATTNESETRQTVDTRCQPWPIHHVFNTVVSPWLSASPGPASIEIPNAILTSGRSTEMVAPEGIAFAPDPALVGSAFGISAPTGDYDRRLHDLRYEWSFGDPGAFVAPVNVRPGYKDSNVAVGFDAAHVYRAPGTYTVRLDIRGTISGQPAHAWSERTVTIGDPETIFGGSRTYFVSPSSNWSQAPAGAQRVTSLDDAAGWSNEGGASGPYRIMLNRGETFAFGGRRFGFNVDIGPTIHVVPGPGAGALPVLNCTGGFGAGGYYDAGYANKTLVVQGVVMTGPYDPVAPGDPDATNSFSFWGSYSPRQILLDRCEMRGFGHGIYLGEDCPRHIYVSDSVIEGYGQWGIIGDGVDGLYLLGTRVQSHVNAPIDNGFNMGGPIRLGGRVGKFVASAIDGFTRQGWSGAGGGYIATQPVIRVEVDEHAGQRINVTRSSMEGGFTMLSLSRGSASPTLNSVVVNALVEDCYFLGGYQTTSVVGNDLGGLTLRDNVTVIPNTTVRVGPGLAAFLELHHFGSAPVLAAPINVIDNTVVNLTNDEITVVSNAPGYSAVTVSGTISHQPALTPPQASAVSLVTSPSMWTPREIGYRSMSAALVAGTATPAGAAVPYTPAPS